ncbi:MAG: hypothetical protein ACOWWM_15390 [Desulfobacterales bacterium]
MRRSLVILSTSLFVLISGCAAPNQIMVYPSTGQTVDCSSVGWGYIGVPTALIATERCASRYEQLGYVRWEDYKELQGKNGVNSMAYIEVESQIAHLKKRGYDHLLENNSLGMKFMIDLSSVIVTDKFVRFQIAEIPVSNHNKVLFTSYAVEIDESMGKQCGVYEDTDDQSNAFSQDSAVLIYSKMIFNGKIKASKRPRPSEYYTVKKAVIRLRKSGYSRLHYIPSNDSYMMLKTDSVKSDGMYVNLVLTEFSSANIDQNDYLYILDIENQKFSAYPAGSVDLGIPSNHYGSDSILALYLKEIGPVK